MHTDHLQEGKIVNKYFNQCNVSLVFDEEAQHGQLKGSLPN